MNETAGVRERADALLAEGPRSRDSVERILAQEGWSRKEIGAALRDVDWQTQAQTIADKVLVRLSSGPHDVLKRLFVAGFTEAEIAKVQSRYDWSELIRPRAELLLRAPFSRVVARTTLLNLGFSPEVVEAELDRYNQAFWEKQAQQAVSEWLEQWESRQTFDPRGMLRDRGFTPLEIAYATDSLVLSLRDVACREAQSLYDRGVSVDGSILALEFAGFPEGDAIYASTTVRQDGRSVYERRVESYMKRDVRTEAGLLQAIGPAPDGTLEDLYDKYGLADVDWVEINRESILRRLEDWREGRARASEFLMRAGYTRPQIVAALKDVDWDAVAAAAAQQYVDELEAFSPDDLREVLSTDDFEDAEIDSAVAAVRWPSDAPPDVDIAWLRRLYVQPALQDEAVEYMVLRGRPEDRVREALAELDLDWSRPLQELADQWFNVQQAVTAATPKMLREGVQGHVTVQLADDALDAVRHDWSAEARRLIREMKEQGFPDTIILRTLYDEEFAWDTIAAMARSERLGESFGPKAAAEHLETLLRTTHYSRSGIESELKALGYSAELLAEAQRISGLELHRVDWRKRALQWIRKEGEQFGLSKEAMRAALLEQGFEKADVTWAIGKHRGDYVQNAVRFAEHLMDQGAPRDQLASLLEQGRFTRAEITAALKQIGS